MNSNRLQIMNILFYAAFIPCLLAYTNLEFPEPAPS